MKIFIDGYNVLKALYAHEITNKQRIAFVHRLKQYARKKGHKIIIVFDGGEGLWPYQEDYEKVIVIYAGQQFTADEILHDLLKKEHADNTILVSSDRELNHYASCLDIVSIDSRDFYGYITRINAYNTLLSQKQIHDLVKITQDLNPELDALMEEASQMEYKHDDSVSVLSKTKAKKESKKERRLRKIVEKL